MWAMHTVNVTPPSKAGRSDTCYNTLNPKDIVFREMSPSQKDKYIPPLTQVSRVISLVERTLTGGCAGGGMGSWYLMGVELGKTRKFRKWMVVQVVNVLDATKLYT